MLKLLKFSAEVAEVLKFFAEVLKFSAEVAEVLKFSAEVLKLLKC